MLLQESIANAAADMERLENDLVRAEEDHQRLQERVEDLTRERDRKIEEAETLKTALDDLTAAHQKLGTKIEENSLENKELEVKVVEIERLRLEHEKKVLTLTDEIETMRVSAEKARNEATEYQSYLEQELETAKADVLDAANTLQELQDKYDWIEQEHQTLQNQVDELSEEKRLAVEELKTKLTEMEAESARRVQKLTAELSTANSNAAKSKEEATEYSSFLEADLEKSKANIVQAATDMQGLEQELKAVTVDRDEKAAEIAKLQASVEDLTNQVSKTQTAGKESAEYSSFLEADLEKSKADIMQALGDMQGLEQELKAVTVDRDEKAAEIAKLQASVDDMKASFEKQQKEQEEYASFLEQEVETSKEDVMQAVHSLEELQGKLDFVSEEAENDIQRHQEEIAEKDEQIESLRQKLASSAEAAQQEKIMHAVENGCHEKDAPNSMEQVPLLKAERVKALRAAAPPQPPAAIAHDSAAQKEQAEYTTFLESELQEAQNNLTEAQAILQRYQSEIAQKDAEMDAAKQSMLAKEKEQAEYTTFLESELQEAQNNLTEAQAILTEKNGALEALQRKLDSTSQEQAHSPTKSTHLTDLEGRPAAPNWEAAVSFTLTLDADFDSIENQEVYKTEFITDVAGASNTPQAFFKFAGLQAGSIINEVLVAPGNPDGANPASIIQGLIEQLNDPNSRLMQGKWTSKSMSIVPSAEPGRGILSKATAVEAELQAAQTKAAKEAKEKEQAEYTTFLESELQEAQNNLSEAQAILQRYQSEIAERDAELSKLQRRLEDIQVAGVAGQSTLASESKHMFETPSTEGQETMQDLRKKLEKAQDKETEQAEYTTFLESELEEAQATAAEAGSGLAAAEEEIEKLSDELQRTRTAFHEFVSKAEADAQHAQTNIENLEREKAVLHERVKNINELQEKLFEQIQAAGTDTTEGLPSNTALDLKFLAEISSLKEQIHVLEDGKMSLERRLEEDRRALQKAETSLGDAVKVANEAEAEAAQLREQTMNALQERSLAAVARDNALKESERLRTDLDELKVKSQTAGALHDSETARKAAEQDLELARDELEQVRERINELEHAVSDLRSDQMEGMERNALLEKELASLRPRTDLAQAEGRADLSKTPKALAEDEAEIQTLESEQPVGTLQVERGKALRAAAPPGIETAADALGPATEGAAVVKKQVALPIPARSKPKQRGSANPKQEEVREQSPAWSKGSLVALCVLLGVVLAAFAGQWATDQTATSGLAGKDLVDIKNERNTQLARSSRGSQIARRNAASEVDAAAEVKSQLTDCQAKLSQHASKTSALQSEASSLRKQLSSKAVEVESLREDILAEKSKAAKAEAEWRDKLDESVQSCKLAKSASQVVLPAMEKMLLCALANCSLACPSTYNTLISARMPLLRAAEACEQHASATVSLELFSPRTPFLLATLLTQDKEELKRQLDRVQDQLATMSQTNAAAAAALNYKAPTNESSSSLNGWWWGGAPQSIQAYREKQAQKARLHLTPLPLAASLTKPFLSSAFPPSLLPLAHCTLTPFSPLHLSLPQGLGDVCVRIAKFPAEAPNPVDSTRRRVCVCRGVGG